MGVAGTTLDKPRRRRQIERLAHNAFPGCAVVFVQAPRGGLAFRIRAANGRFRSGTIKLLSHHGHIRLNRDWLARELRAHGGSTAP